MKNSVTLFIAEHNKTGLKYFGKTTKYSHETDLLKNYKGSGKYWKAHLRKYGRDVNITIYKICSLNPEDENYVEPIALEFSINNDIVNSKLWANLILENGLDGGDRSKCRVYSEHTHQTKEKISNRLNEILPNGKRVIENANLNRLKTIREDSFDGSYEFGIKSNETKRSKILDNGLTVMEQQSINMSNYINNNREKFEDQLRRSAETNSNKHWVDVFDNKSSKVERIRYKEFRQKYPETLLKYDGPNLSYKFGPCKYPQYRGWYAIKSKV